MPDEETTITPEEETPAEGVEEETEETEKVE